MLSFQKTLVCKLLCQKLCHLGRGERKKQKKTNPKMLANMDNTLQNLLRIPYNSLPDYSQLMLGQSRVTLAGDQNNVKMALQRK